MDLIRDIEDIDPRYRGGALSVGVFDGVHLGHRPVLGRTVERARALGVQPVVFTFHPHPLQVLRPAEAPPLIQTFGQKLEILREIGIGAVIWPRDTGGVLAMTARDFFDRLVGDALGARAMVEGADFRFGAGAGGGPRELQDLAAARGIPLTLSGHYHGGQIKLSLPGGDLSLAHLWTPYPVGLYRIDASHLYVSRGIGTTFTPVRLNVPPEVTLFHLS